MGTALFVFLNDPGGQQRLIRFDHISFVVHSRTDQSTTLHMVGGQQLHLTHEEAKQFVHHTKGHMQALGAA